MRTRRGFLACTASAVGARAVLPAMAGAETLHPDAELLKVCAAFDALERQYLATDFGQPSRSPKGAAAEAERDRLHNAQRPLVNRMCQLRAVTREGHAARARSYALWDAEMMKPQHDIEGLFTQAIVRDLIG